MDELIKRYTNPAGSSGKLPDRLKLMEIAALAYPGDESEQANARFKFANVLQRAIESGELVSAGTVAETYLAIPPKKAQRHVVDRTAFAEFLQAQGVKPVGRIAEWVAGADNEEKPIREASPSTPVTTGTSLKYRKPSRMNLWLEVIEHSIRLFARKNKSEPASERQLWSWMQTTQPGGYDVTWNGRLKQFEAPSESPMGWESFRHRFRQFYPQDSGK